MNILDEQRTKEATALRLLQDEQKPWVRHNFPGRSAHQPLLGIVEELGELDEACAARWGDSGMLTTDALDDVVDALGDSMVFASDYCTSLGWDFAHVWQHRKEPQWVRKDELFSGLLLRVAGKLCHCHLKREQGIRGSTEHLEQRVAALLGELLWLLEHVAKQADVSLVDVTLDVWNKVRCRDFQKYPINGLSE